MHAWEQQLYLLGGIICLLNVGLAVWFSGLFTVVNGLSAALVAGTILWSVLGAPGADSLGAYFFN